MRRRIAALVFLVLLLLAAAGMAEDNKTGNVFGQEKASYLNALEGVRNLKINVSGMTAKLSWKKDRSNYCTGYAIYLCRRLREKPSNPPFGRYTKRNDGYYWVPYKLLLKTKSTKAKIKASGTSTMYLEVDSYYKSPSKYVTRHGRFVTFKPFKPLTAPQNVTAKQIGKNRVKLTWSASSNADHYVVCRKIGSTFKQIGTTKKLFFTDKKVKNGKNYKYKILAVKGNQKKWSKVVLAYPRNAPKLTLKNPGDGKMHLSWNKVKNASKYQVYVKYPGMDQFKKLTTTANRKISIPFSKGSGRYYCYVVPVKGSFQMLRSDIEYIDVVMPTAYRALVIGQSYTDTENPMPASRFDNAAMGRMLLDLKGTDYGSNVVRVLTDVSKAEVLAAIDGIFGQANSGDVTLLYFSGRGGSDGKLECADQTTISIQELRTRLDRHMGKKVIILDSDYSGAAIGKKQDSGMDAKAAAGQFNAAVMRMFRQPAGKNGDSLLDADGYYVLTACSGNQMSYRSQAFSLFTRELLAGLGWALQNNSRMTDMPADRNGDAKVTLQEAYEYVSQQILAGTDGAMNVAVYPKDCGEIFFAR